MRFWNSHRRLRRASAGGNTDEKRRASLAAPDVAVSNLIREYGRPSRRRSAGAGIDTSPAPARLTESLPH